MIGGDDSLYLKFLEKAYPFPSKTTIFNQFLLITPQP